MRCERVLRGQAWASEAGTRGKPGHALRHLGKRGHASRAKRGHALRWRQPGHLQRLSKDPDNDCPRIRTTTVQGSGQRLSKDPDPEGIDAGTDAVRSSDADAGTDAVHKGV
jgi:hypothetical protein